jgi:mannose-6-phosphate isomerase-like protein (cupin superfamily)
LASVPVGHENVVVIPSGVPHRWVNHTQEPLVHTGGFSTESFPTKVVDDKPGGQGSDTRVA